MTIGAGAGLVRLPEHVEEKLNVSVNDLTWSSETLKLTAVPCPVPAHSPAYPAGTGAGPVGLEQAAGHTSSNTPSPLARIDRIVFPYCIPTRPRPRPDPGVGRCGTFTSGLLPGGASSCSTSL